MKTLILSAIAASALFVSGASAQSHYYGGGYGGSHYGGGYGRGHAAPGPYHNVGSYDSYAGSYAGHRGGYGHSYRVRIRPSTVRRSYGYSSAPRYASQSYAPSYAPLQTLGTTYVSPPYTLPEYDYQYPTYSSGGTYSRPYAVPSSYGYGGGSYGTVNTVPYSQTYSGNYDYRCNC